MFYHQDTNLSSTFSFVTESASHMTGSTHMDIEVINETDFSTRGPETETKPGNKNNLEPNIYDTARRPNIIIAELFSRKGMPSQAFCLQN